MAVEPEPGCVVVRLRGVSGMGRHGVLDHERARPQPFVVDIAMLLAEPADDRLDDTVDYGRIAGIAVSAIESEPVNLIETLAARIADRCLGIARLRTVEVCVHKPHAPIPYPFDDVSATVHRSVS